MQMSEKCSIVVYFSFHFVKERFTKAGQNAAIHITNAPNEPSIEETEDVVIKLAGSWYDKEIINGVHYGWAELIKKLPSGEFMRKQ